MLVHEGKPLHRLRHYPSRRPMRPKAATRSRFAATGPLPVASCAGAAGGQVTDSPPAPGYRPVLEGGIHFDSRTELSAEGIHFHDIGVDGGVALHNVDRYLARLANCSLDGQGILRWNWPCLVNAQAATADGKPAEITNCLIQGNIYLHLPPDGGKVILNRSWTMGLCIDTSQAAEYRMEIRRCVIGNSKDSWPHCAAWCHGRRFSFSAEGTLFGADGPLLCQNGDLQVSAWHGSANVYRIPSCVPWLDAQPEGVPAGLEAWKKRWQSDADSIELDPSAYDPRQWRLLPGSPGYREGPEGKDFGADPAGIGVVDSRR